MLHIETDYFEIYISLKLMLAWNKKILTGIPQRMDLSVVWKFLRYYPLHLNTFFNQKIALEIIYIAIYE